jgi:hypothetical protein
LIAWCEKSRPVRDFFPARSWLTVYRRPGAVAGVEVVSKGLDQKRDTKKKPVKTLLEKRAAKAEKHQKKT